MRYKIIHADPSIDLPPVPLGDHNWSYYRVNQNSVLLAVVNGQNLENFGYLSNVSFYVDTTAAPPVEILQPIATYAGAFAPGATIAYYFSQFDAFWKNFEMKPEEFNIPAGTVLQINNANNRLIILGYSD